MGVFPEARIFTEIALLLYLPICIALNEWLSGEPALVIETTGMWYFFNRYAVIGILIFIVVFQKSLNQVIMAITS
jgi:hypothetical protein